ncbi:DUF885 family protein [Sphingosinicella sp. CPCC 101087]|uniref:DUF885 domain-containing protein n=1 Tax=Sphingosinicella sp. CPCC 101087 TaxID=2497754 RepID=UPI00101BA710|nr:DUF885 domain-containing protein [Sphingosinicella sp. CPCC 101087]
MITRRTLLVSGTAAALAVAARPAVAAPGSEDDRLRNLLQRHAELFVIRSPEEATGLGLDVGSRQFLRERLDDRSIQARERDLAAVREARTALRAIDRARLSAPAALDFDVAAFVYDVLGDQLGRYGYVDSNLRPSPYVANQMNGAYYWLPDFIGSRHPLETPADVNAYFARLEALGTAIDQETARIRLDASRGVTLPGFINAKTVAQLTRLRDGPPSESALIRPAAERAAARGLGDLTGRATDLFRTAVAPALTRQIDALLEQRPAAVDTAGVWRLPEGEAYYRSALRSNTTASIDPSELHRRGLDQFESLASRLDVLLAGQGLASGSVSDRIKALNQDARYRVSSDDAGRERLIAAARAHIAEVSRRLPQAFGTIPDRPVIVRRMPLTIEDSSPGAFYNPGAPGGPGIYSLNLKRPEDLSLWRLPTLTHHESIPGHHFQHSVLKEAAELSLFRQLVRFSAYTEGWALYAEQVAGELGVYDDNPIGRIGLLQSQIFRAARIVVDTGIHHERWTREQAVGWMVDRAGEPRVASEREIDRYCVYPGQACSFMVGANQIVEMREGARSRMGSRFDVRDFHDLVLTSGPLPMEVLGGAVGAWSGA